MIVASWAQCVGRFLVDFNSLQERRVGSLLKHADFIWTHALKVGSPVNVHDGEGLAADGYVTRMKPNGWLEIELLDGSYREDNWATASRWYLTDD